MSPNSLKTRDVIRSLVLLRQIKIRSLLMLATKRNIHSVQFSSVSGLKIMEQDGLTLFAFKYFVRFLKEWIIYIFIYIIIVNTLFKILGIIPIFLLTSLFTKFERTSTSRWWRYDSQTVTTMAGQTVECTLDWLCIVGQWKDHRLPRERKLHPKRIKC